MQTKNYFKPTRLWLVGVAMGVASTCALAQSGSVNDSGIKREDLSQWALRVEQAAKQQNYVGTYTIAQSNQLQTLATVHAYEGGSDYELVHALDGAERLVFRKDQAYYAVNPSKKNIILERKSVAQMFPSFTRVGCGGAEQHYGLTVLGTERFIGREADVVQITPADELRHGYKAWVDRDTGLLLRLDVQDTQGKTLQRVAFSSLELNTDAVKKKELPKYIDGLKAQGYQEREWPFVHIKIEEQGWELKTPPAGFQSINTVLRPISDLTKELIQWVFSDGIASVSIFIEKADGRTKTNQHQHSYGATNGISYQQGEWQITIVGEAPEETLTRFSQALNRTVKH